MGKAMFVAATAVSVLLVLGEALAAALLWSQGKLNEDSVREIRAILQEDWATNEAESKDGSSPSVAVEDVVATRAIRILHLEEREREQELLKALVADSRSSILKEQESVQATRAQFEQEREAAAAKAASESITQSRAILLKTDAATAMAQLMKLDLDESVELIAGMPEKKIAELLQTFAAGDKEQIARGQEVFQAITRGTPKADLPDAQSLNSPAELQ